MRIDRLVLSSFRSYPRADLLFEPGINRIEGLNGSGKSNLLEAIHLLSTGKSFRTGRLQELIKYGEERLSLQAFFHKDGTDQKLTVLFSKQEKKVIYNETPHNTFLSLLGIIPSVFISPEDGSIVSGGPSERRRFLDLHIAQKDPNYVLHLGRYQRALKQRNHLLKTKQKGIAVWEELMSISASSLTDARIETLDLLEKKSRRFLLHLSKDKEPLEIRYQNSMQVPSDPESYRKKWQETRGKELLLGTTLVGPHRDEILFLINGKEAGSYASEGQKRSVLTALRLAQWSVLADELRMKPLFGIDDFGVHLDEERSRCLEELLQDPEQVFLTAPSFDPAASGRRIRISELTPVSFVKGE